MWKKCNINSDALHTITEWAVCWQINAKYSPFGFLLVCESRLKVVHQNKVFAKKSANTGLTSRFLSPSVNWLFCCLNFIWSSAFFRKSEITTVKQHMLALLYINNKIKGTGSRDFMVSHPLHLSSQKVDIKQALTLLDFVGKGRRH